MITIVLYSLLRIEVCVCVCVCARARARIGHHYDYLSFYVLKTYPPTNSFLAQLNDRVYGTPAAK